MIALVFCCLFDYCCFGLVIVGLLLVIVYGCLVVLYCLICCYLVVCLCFGFVLNWFCGVVIRYWFVYLLFVILLFK